MLRPRRVALAAAVSGVLAAGGVTVFALTSQADAADSCTNTQGTNATCSLTATVNAPASITLHAVTTPTGLAVEVKWTDTCTASNGASLTTTGDSTVTSPAFVNVGLAGVTSPTSCKVSATATMTAAGTNADQLQLTLYDTTTTGSTPTPTPTAASSTPTPAPTAAATHYSTVHGFGGKCLDDAGNKTVNRAKIEIWSCSSTDPAQGWSYRSGLLKHNGLCLNAKGLGVKGAAVMLWSCNGGANETWTHKSNGEYVLKAGGGKECLTDPGNATKNGTGLNIWTCVNYPNQHWSLP